MPIPIRCFMILSTVERAQVW